MPTEPVEPAPTPAPVVVERDDTPDDDYPGISRSQIVAAVCVAATCAAVVIAATLLWEQWQRNRSRPLGVVVPHPNAGRPEAAPDDAPPPQANTGTPPAAPSDLPSQPPAFPDITS
jgi:hypothetical protein